MTAYWIAWVSVTDEAAYGEYAKRGRPAIERHGGRFFGPWWKMRDIRG